MSDATEISNRLEKLEKTAKVASSLRAITLLAVMIVSAVFGAVTWTFAFLDSRYVKVCGGYSLETAGSGDQPFHLSLAGYVDAGETSAKVVGAPGHPGTRGWTINLQGAKAC